MLGSWSVHQALRVNIWHNLSVLFICLLQISLRLYRTLQEMLSGHLDQILTYLLFPKFIAALLCILQTFLFWLQRLQAALLQHCFHSAEDLPPSPLKSNAYLYSAESFSDVCRANHVSFLVLQLANWKHKVEHGSSAIITKFLQSPEVVLCREIL